MPTLVLLIPYNSGALIISDRQSTKNGTKKEWNKIYHLDKWTVIGFCGSSEGSDFLARILMVTNKNDQPLWEQYRASYQSLEKLLPKDEIESIQALSISKRAGIIEFYNFIGNIYNLLPVTKPIGIGSGEVYIRPQLSRNTDTIILDQAIEFGKTLIEYASKVDSEVGTPSQFGFCLAIVPLNEEISFNILPPQHTSIDKLLYKFDISNSVDFSGRLIIKETWSK